MPHLSRIGASDSNLVLSVVAVGAMATIGEGELKCPLTAAALPSPLLAPLLDLVSPPGVKHEASVRGDVESQIVHYYGRHLRQIDLRGGGTANKVHDESAFSLVSTLSYVLVSFNDIDGEGWHSQHTMHRHLSLRHGAVTAQAPGESTVPRDSGSRG